MTRYLVTGCAGFIGSHLSDRLLSDGHEVIGVDAFTDYYPRLYKEKNLSFALDSSRFRLYEGDLLSLPLAPLLRRVDVVFHQAAQAGVRASWGSHFNQYTNRNVLATQRLLEACRSLPSLRRFVYASSSSIYGNATELPVRETTPSQPVSPYGVTKLAGEHLVNLYHVNFGFPTVALRYFTVYGARQRPDMAFHRFIRAALVDEPITVYEDGHQTRDFTHVSDIVEANLSAAREHAAIGGTYNVAGGARVTLNDVLHTIGSICRHALTVRYEPEQAGDVRNTHADISRAKSDLRYQPVVDLNKGLRDEVEWLQWLYSDASLLRDRVRDAVRV